MDRASQWHPWLLAALPLAFIFFGVAMFALRWWRLRRREDPEVLLLGAVSQSLQERGALAASLGELRTVHERVLDALPFGLLWVDQRQEVAGLNRAGRELLGVRPGVVGLEAAFVLEPFPWILDGLGRDPGAAWRCDGGGRRWSLRRIHMSDKVGALIQFEDITAAEQEERRLQLRDRFAELGEMTAGVAHQLKNGLAVFKAQGQLLVRAGHTAEGSALLEETEELGLLVQRFLQWAKPLEPQCVGLNLQEIAAQALRELAKRPLAQGRELLLEGEGRAQADPVLLHQALVNLLENACQATPSGGSVRMVIGEGCIEILDEGPGFGEETLIRMLRPFESGRPDGTGLGLPLALKWLNAQGADLRFLPGEGGGTRVVVQW
nr:ATP-binding protein [uncultured Holophaga sp.]